MDNFPPELAKAVPGVAGSLVSMLFIKDTWPRRVAMFCAGSALSIFGSAWVTKFSGLDAGFSGFILGLFGMAIVAKFFQTWETFELSVILRDWVRKLLGLPPKEA